MKKVKVFVVMFLLSLILAASGTEAETAATGHVDWFSVMGKVFNSTVLFGGLILLLRKPLIAMLAEKSAMVKNDFQEREKNLANAAARLKDIEQRLQKVGAEVTQIKSSAMAGGQEELSHLEAAGREEAARIIAFSEEEIRLRVEAAVRLLKSNIADLAIERFKKDFIENLNDVIQQKIIERNIAACGDMDEGK